MPGKLLWRLVAHSGLLVAGQTGVLYNNKNRMKNIIFYSYFTVLSPINIHFIYYGAIAQLKDDIFRVSGFARQHAQVNTQTKNE